MRARVRPRPVHHPAGNSALAMAMAAAARKCTTVFVGKIPPLVDDGQLRRLLAACGRVKAWTRQVDPSTKEPRNFGFCDFAEPDDVLRALRLLNGRQLLAAPLADGGGGDPATAAAEPLVVKCNSATQAFLDEYQAVKAAERADAAARDREAGEIEAGPVSAGEGGGAAAAAGAGAALDAEELKADEEVGARGLFGSTRSFRGCLCWRVRAGQPLGPVGPSWCHVPPAAPSWVQHWVSLRTRSSSCLFVFFSMLSPTSPRLTRT